MVVPPGRSDNPPSGSGDSEDSEDGGHFPGIILLFPVLVTAAILGGWFALKRLFFPKKKFTSQAAEKMSSKAKDWASDSIHKGTDWAKEHAGQGKDLGSKAKDWASDSIDKGTDWAKQHGGQGKDLGSKAKDWASDLMDKGKDAADPSIGDGTSEGRKILPDD